MKVYLEKGHSMRANLRLYPYKIQHLKTADNAPEEIRAHTLVIFGDADETVSLHGSLRELQELAKLMAEALEGAEE